MLTNENVASQTSHTNKEIVVKQTRLIRLCHVATIPGTVLKLMGPQLTWFQGQGYEITVITSPGEQLNKLRSQFGVSAIPIEMKRAICPISDAVAFLRLTATLLRNRFDIVHVHTPKASFLASLAGAVTFHRRRIYTQRGLRYEELTGKRRTLFKFIEWLTCRLNHRVICVSASAREVAIQDRLCPGDKLQVLAHGSSNGVDSARFSNAALSMDPSEIRLRLGIPDGSPLAGFVGRLTRDKGISDLLQAARLVRESGCDLHLLIIGPWDESDPVSSECRRTIENEPWIHFEGDVEAPELCYGAMDFMVFPSYREGFPNVVLEAAASGLPTVGYVVTGVRDAIIDNETGLLVKERSAVALSSAIKWLIQNDNDRRRMGDAARLRAERDFQPENVWASLERVYATMLSSGLDNSSKKAQCLQRKCY